MADALDYLKSIDATLKQLLARMPAAPPEVAPDADLDSQYGDPVIKTKDPRDWAGASMQGKPFSRCPPEYLELVADRLDYFADKDEAEGTLTSSGKPKAPYERKDAARARGWAKRIRAGWKPAVDPFAEEAKPFASDALTSEDIFNRGDPGDVF